MIKYVVVRKRQVLVDTYNPYSPRDIENVDEVFVVDTLDKVRDLVLKYGDEVLIYKCTEQLKACISKEVVFN